MPHRNGHTGMTHRNGHTGMAHRNGTQKWHTGMVKGLISGKIHGVTESNSPATLRRFTVTREPGYDEAAKTFRQYFTRRSSS